MAPSHYLNQCWDIVKWTLRNKLQWNFNQNSNIFIQENAFESVSWEMAAILSWSQCVNSLAPGKFEWNFWYIILQIISVIDGWGISCELALRWMSLSLTDDKSTLVQVMAWCRQAASHYLSQCWPRYLSPYGVTRPQWVNSRAVSWLSWLIHRTWMSEITGMTCHQYLWQVVTEISPGGLFMNCCFGVTKKCNPTWLKINQIWLIEHLPSQILSEVIWYLTHTCWCGIVTQRFLCTKLITLKVYKCSC